MYNNSLRDSGACFRIVLVLLLLVLLVPSLGAQTSSTAALTGTVTDPTGAVIANATVTATNSGNGQVRTTTTGSDGVYKFSLLPPGSYSVKFEASGFETSEVPGVALDVTETPVLNRTLTVGSQSQQVTVEAETETVQTASSALGTVIAPKTVTDIPLSTRNYQNLISLSAGANADVNNADQPGKGFTFLYVNGSDSNQNNFQMDGATVDNYFSFGAGNDNGFYAALPIPNPDAIQEFKIQTSTYDAGYGRNPGANVNVVTRSGTNEFHGAAFEFFRNRFFNANEWFFKRSEFLNKVDGVSDPLPNKPPVLNQNQYGGTFGGPIKKDKLFFFVSYQETGQKNGLTSYGFQTANLPPIPGPNSVSSNYRGTCTTPTWTSLSQCDASTASFVSALATAISPNCPGNSAVKQDIASSGTVGAVQVACPSLSLTGTNAVNGPTGLYNINPVAINLLQLKLGNNYYIPGSTTGPYAANAFSSPDVYTEHQAMGNIDYTINSKNTLSERYIYSTDPSSAPFGCGISGNAFCVPGQAVTYQYWQHAGTLKLTSLLSNNVVNEAHVAFQRYSSFSNNQNPFAGPQVGITPLASSIPGLTQITVTSEFEIGAQSLFGLKLIVQQIEGADQLSWTRGKHTFRFGGEFEHDVTTIRFTGLHLGAPSFSTFADLLIGRCGTVPGCALSNNTANSNEASLASNSIVNAYNDQLESVLPVDTLSVFAQDDYKVNSRLTLNLGLRWEWFGLVTTDGGAWSNTWTSLLQQAPIPGTGCSQNGVTFGLGATGTGCSLIGVQVPSTFPGSVPAGVYRANNPYITSQGAKLDNFAPRIGFAWQPLATNSRLVVRGGGGYFFDRPNGLLLTEDGHSNPPFAIGVAQNNLATLANPFILPPTIPGPPGTPGWTPRWVYSSISGANGTNGSAVSSNLSGNNTVDPNFTNGLVYEWNLNTQYEFLPTWVLELGYVGSRGLRETVGMSGHEGVPQPINTANLASATNPLSCGYDGVASDCITTNTTGNLLLRVPYLGYSTVFAPATTHGQDKFNSLQATVRKQLSHGLTLQAAYTWARSFVNYYIGNPNAIAPGVQNYTDPYGINTQYRPQRLTVNYSWDIPTGKHDGMMGQVLNGWNLAGVTTIQDGDPLLITDTRAGTAFTAAGSNITALTSLCPGVTPSMVATSGSVSSKVNDYFYTGGSGAFCAPALIPGSTNARAFGNYGLGEVLGPAQADWDLTLTKTFKIKESQTLQFRTESFNVFNHSQFSVPTTTAASGAGVISTTSVNPRLMQFALKYLF